jgi:hypothetical protein
MTGHRARSGKASSNSVRVVVEDHQRRQHVHKRKDVILRPCPNGRILQRVSHTTSEEPASTDLDDLLLLLEVPDDDDGDDDQGLEGLAEAMEREFFGPPNDHVIPDEKRDPVCRDLILHMFTCCASNICTSRRILCKIGCHTAKNMSTIF